jgi:hypothetical protein
LVASAKGKPRYSNLRRATSTTYYALFHALARSCADMMVGGPGSKKSKPAWKQVYRALDHGAAKNACLNGTLMAKFPQEVQDFANVFVQMQAKRHAADYDPDYKAYKSAVLSDIAAVTAVIDDFGNTPAKDKRAFVALVLFKARP